MEEPVRILLVACALVRLADLFRTISLNIKIAVLPFENDVFARAEQEKSP